MARILIVDDSEPCRYMLQVLLESKGHEVVTAADGAEALDQAATSSPDVVISDILMPGMDGFAFCRRWKTDARFRTIPFVFYTATYTDPGDQALGRSAGADRFLVKPLDGDKFLRSIETVIDDFRAGRLRAVEPILADETTFAQDYNAVLVRRLEAKLEQLNATKAALAASEGRARHILETSVETIIGVDQGGLVVLVNTRAEAMFGYQRGELMGRHLEYLVPDDVREPLRQHLAAFLEGRQERLIDAGLLWRARRKDESVFPADVSLSWLPSGADAIVAVVVRDLTEQYAAERVRSEERERLHLALRASGTGTWTWALETDEMVLDNHTLRLLGLAPETYGGQFDDFLDLVDPDDREIVREAATVALEGQRPFDTLFRTQGSQGGPVRYLEARGQLIRDASGRRVSVTGICQDMTERREMQAAIHAAQRDYRSIFDNALEGIFQSTEDGRLLTVNQAFAEMLGYRSPQELMAAVQDVGHEIYVDPNVRETLLTRVRTEGKAVGFEAAVRRKDGAVITVRISSRLVKNTDGSVRFFEGFVADITERGRLDAERRQS